jgi:hypothetical protein
MSPHVNGMDRRRVDARCSASCSPDLLRALVIPYGDIIECIRLRCVHLIEEWIEETERLTRHLHLRDVQQCDDRREDRSRRRGSTSRRSGTTLNNQQIVTDCTRGEDEKDTEKKPE